MVAYQTAIVEKKIQDFTSSVVQAIAIVILVMLVMLGLRTGLVVASLVPAAMLMTLMVMGFMNIGLDQMSLAGLIIALGMLVDNAIVMSESIMVSMGRGTPPAEAAISSANELKIPLLTSSLTTAAAFLPIYLSPGTLGEYTGVLFTIVTITLLSSWLLSLTIVPLLCARFLKVKVEEQNFDSLFYRSYRGLLLGLLRVRFLALLLVAGVFYLALLGFGRIPSIFFPPSDTPMMMAEFRLPIGTAIEATEGMVKSVEDYMQRELVVNEEHPEGIVSWSAFIGQGGPRFTLTYNPESPSPEYAMMIINLTTDRAISEVSRKLEDFCKGNFPSVMASMRGLQLGAPVDKPIEVRIMGDDRETVFEIADAVKAKIASIPGTKNISDNWGQQAKRILVEVNANRARRSGVTHEDIGVSLQSVLSGVQATEYREGEEIIPVTLRSVAANRQDIGKLEGVNVYSQIRGTSVPLQQVAHLEVDWQPAKVLRRDTLQAVTVRSELIPGAIASEITNEIIPWLEDQRGEWPPGYYYGMGGEIEQSLKGNAALVQTLPIGAFIIIILLLTQFNSVRRPLIILLTIPLGIVGIVAGLLICDSYFGFMTLLGLISLAGIVINNAIVLIDRIDLEIRDNGLQPSKAIIESAQQRLRPILLTTMTTVGGLLPLWFGGGPMWESLAIAIIFGLLFATCLTLGLVPILYSLLFRVSFKGFRYTT